MTDKILDLKTSSRRIALIVTVFTLSHSIALGMASMHWVRISSTLVESIIALSIIIMALNIVFNFFDEKRRLWITFAFGLFHGLGFASVFEAAEQSLGQQLFALFGFNLGVELGQLAIVLLVFPLIYSLRHQTFYRGPILTAGATCSAVLGVIWLAERVFQITLLPIF